MTFHVLNFLCKQVKYLPNINHSISRIDRWLFPRNLRTWDKIGDGAAQCTTREWFFKVGGYDERMELYGAMDNDMTVRAEKDGLNIVWVEEGEMLHMHHKIVWNNPEWKEQFDKNIIQQGQNPIILDNEVFNNTPVKE